jgi:hypothetical protein
VTEQQFREDCIERLTRLEALLEEHSKSDERSFTAISTWTKAIAVILIGGAIAIIFSGRTNTARAAPEIGAHP